MYITVYLFDNILKKMPLHSKIVDLLDDFNKKEIVGALVNGKITDLQDELLDNSTIDFIKKNSKLGLCIIRHSCEHIMAAAVFNLFKNVKLATGSKYHKKNFYYDFLTNKTFSINDIVSIESVMRKFIDQHSLFKKTIVSKEQAHMLFNKYKQIYKSKILDWITDSQVSLYENNGFVDLCKGPHVPHTGFIKAFKILSVSGSYWKSNINNKILQRITGVAFNKKQDLCSYFFNIKEAKKRDHRQIGSKMQLFMVSQKYKNHKLFRKNGIDISISGYINNKFLFENDLINNIFNNNILKKVYLILKTDKICMSTFFILPFSGFSKNRYFELNIKIIFGFLNYEYYHQFIFLENILNKKYINGKIKFILKSQRTEEIGPGLISWLPMGGRLRSVLEKFSRKIHFYNDYEIVYSPHIAKSDLWKLSGHWDFYKDSMFSPILIDNNEYILKPMNCPFHLLMYKRTPKSYRDLPIKVVELGTVYRYEMGGVLNGLIRVRGFTQDDAHIFCRWDQVKNEVDKVLILIISVLKVFGFKKIEFVISTQPKHFIGSQKEWVLAEKILIESVKQHNIIFNIDHGGGAFYGPKIDIKLKDCLGRFWQCSTLQLDFNNPEIFDLFFINSRGKKERTVMLHRALFGSIERFIGILIEHYAGVFPMWLAPDQLRIITIADRHIHYAITLEKKLKKMNFRVSFDYKNEKLGTKIREAQIDKVPVMLIIGDNEVLKKGYSVRFRDGYSKGFMVLKQLIKFLKKESYIPNIFL